MGCWRIKSCRSNSWIVALLYRRRMRVMISGGVMLPNPVTISAALPEVWNDASITRVVGFFEVIPLCLCRLLIAIGDGGLWHGIYLAHIFWWDERSGAHEGILFNCEHISGPS
eukprot:scaffold25948_cov32-Attheya_sp.AAC.4